MTPDLYFQIPDSCGALCLHPPTKKTQNTLFENIRGKHVALVDP